MTPAGEVLRDEIRRSGPIPFRRFMETALYHPEFGYYRQARDPFGREGDFFTAEQVQPVFGILMAALVRKLHSEMGAAGAFTVVELGAGREEMALAFSEWRYVPVDIDRQNLPEHFDGVVFCNEFFDALAVDSAQFTAGEFREQLVSCTNGRFVWAAGGRVNDAVDDYLRRYFPEPEEGRLYEANLEALVWVERIARALDRGWVITIDYGYTRRESVRFARGTLMGYRRHTAREDVLDDPGERDITAHVNFSALEDHGAACGLASNGLQTLAQTLLDAGESDKFACVLEDGIDEREQLRRRMQLKTLLFGMGETFRTLRQKK